MSNDLTQRNDLPKRTDPTKPERQKSNDAGSRLKRELMADALHHLFGDDESIDAPDKSKPPRVIIALANHGRSPGWDRAKVLERQMFDAAAGSGLEMKFAFYGPDDAAGVRRCRITKRWITDPDDMGGVMDRAECGCGCYVNVRDVLAQAVKEAEDRPLRAVIIVGDAFHDDLDGLDEAAISANRLWRAGTQVFLIQLGDEPITASKLKYLKRVSGATYFPFDLSKQERQFTEMWTAMSTFAAGGEQAVKTRGGQAATLLLQVLEQAPMPIIAKRDRVWLDPDNKE
jgi:hypothetical protein